MFVTGQSQSKVDPLSAATSAVFIPIHTSLFSPDKHKVSTACHNNHNHRHHRLHPARSVVNSRLMNRKLISCKPSATHPPLLATCSSSFTGRTVPALFRFGPLRLGKLLPNRDALHFGSIFPSLQQKKTWGSSQRFKRLTPYIDH